MKARKFLIIRFSSIGDIILTSPVLRAIRRRFPSAEIHFLTKKQNVPLVSYNPNLNWLHLFKKRNMRPMVKALRREKYDYVIDLQKSLRTWWLKRRLHTKSLSFHKLNIRKWLLTTFKINRMPAVHIVDRYMSTVKCLDVEDDCKGLDFVIPTETVLPSFFNNMQNKFVALVIGAQHYTKRIPYSKLVLLCGLIDYQVVVLGGAAERAVGECLERECPNVCSFAGVLDIYQSAKVLQLSRVVITPDTGLMHIAAALKKDIFSVWGNTVPDFGMYPYMAGEKSQIFEVKALKCRPCSKIGYEECPRKHFKCMNELNYDALAIQVNACMSADSGATA